MNISEANAVNHLLTNLIDPEKVDPEVVRDSAIFLAEKANKSLHAGWTGEQVRERYS